MVSEENGSITPIVEGLDEGSWDVYQVGFVNCTVTGMYPGSGGGWRSDPLLTIPAGGVSVTTSQPVVFWLSVTIPSTATVGKLTFTNLKGVSVPISLTPWAGKLPSAWSIHHSFGEIWSFNIHYVENMYGSDFNQEVAQNYYNLMTDSLLPPDDLYQARPNTNFSFYNYLINSGAYLLNVGAIGQTVRGCPHPFTPEWVNQTIESIAPTVERILKANTTSKPYVYGFDEQPTSCEANIRSLFGAVKSRWGDKVLTVAALNWKEMPSDLPLDIWVLQYQTYNKTKASAWQASGHQIFLYHCIEPSGADYLNTFIEHNRTQGRQLYWYGAMNNVDGWLYYATDIWNSYPGTNHTPIKRIDGTPKTDFPPANYIWAPRTDIFANGDGQFLYPGVGGTAVPSARLLLQRDAVEDQVLLSAALKKDKTSTLNLIHKVVRGATDHTDDTLLLEDTRIAISKIVF
eukprot:TRINITY_DN5113_c0_g1_i4.p1 TRINITY_DN5113_c0_g1~~TRINITY_DN5113_c0_g1_i4.p1  ORF type:complete len:536 (+),score=117.52 TRINITY_DN5113_c0_g1_i4:235-1608(+)